MIRGDITTKDGVVVATSKLDEEQNETRVYPEGELYAHAIGYATKGMSGVELDANYTLLNSHIDMGEQAKAAITGEKIPGDTVVTTLNSSLQECAMHNLGTYNGAVLALDPETGAILAMVSRPSFDPNTIALKWEEIVEDTESSVLLNRATQGLYPPGSTFKIVTGLEYLAEGGSMDDTFHCNGSLSSGDYTIHCYNGAVHGNEDFIKAFAKSCNVAFAEMGVDLDKESYQKKAEELMFNKTLPTRLSSTSVSRFDISKANEGMIMQTAIGQGETLITPLHLAMIVAAASNEGKVMEPYIIDRIINANGTLVRKTIPVSGGRIMSKEEAEDLMEMLRAVITDNYSSKFADANYTAYGKTGTAEFSSNKDYAHSWFVGTAEKGGKKITVVVIMEEAGLGGQFSMPLAQRMFDVYFQ